MSDVGANPRAGFEVEAARDQEKPCLIDSGVA
jgi:hypothetical protein